MSPKVATMAPRMPTVKWYLVASQNDAAAPGQGETGVRQVGRGRGDE
jgi:hypothetical protein